ncbi:MAG TPA: aminoacyl-tRNA hydrolase [Firmicutes bacterium]|nr:aminoacyl-tRNA hydrolase [Bacillota bacterium]
MFCIAGLGNPGPQYQETRHNAGFLVINHLAQQIGVKLNKSDFKSLYVKALIGEKDTMLLEPQTFMNLSGQAVSSAASYFKIPLEQLLIVYDDMDLPLGKIRFRLSGSPGGHKGLTSIIQMMGTEKIPRLRVGIGRPENSQTVVDYVLNSFNGAERKIFMDSIERAAIASTYFVTDGPDYVMNHFNRSE